MCVYDRVFVYDEDEVVGKTMRLSCTIVLRRVYISYTVRQTKRERVSVRQFEIVLPRVEAKQACG